MRVAAPTPTDALNAAALLRSCAIEAHSQISSSDTECTIRQAPVDCSAWAGVAYISRTQHLWRWSVVSDAAVFQHLVGQWHVQRGATSSLTQMLSAPAYQRIIGMGERAIPFILKRLEEEGEDPDHWGWALHAITGEDPVPPEAAGDTLQIAQAWLAWGQGQYAR